MFFSKVGVVLLGFLFNNNSDRRFLNFKIIDVEYSFLLWFVGLSYLLAVILMLVSYYVAIKNLDYEKKTGYECGFEPFSSSLGVSDVSFCIVGVLFILFDIELVFLYPWVMALPWLSVFGFGVGIFFMLILLLGFVCEWSSGLFDLFSADLRVADFVY